MAYRDHTPIAIDKFNGLWDRNDPDSVPLDHFQDCNNIKYVGSNSFTVRDGINISQSVSVPVSKVKRIYNFATASGNTLLILSYDSGVGRIYHVVNATTTYGPILTIYGMSDFAFVAYAGRAYLSPFTTYPSGDLNIEKGLDSEFVYVYKGDGTAARKAAGDPITGTLTIANGNPGHTDAGFHLFGFVAETDTGYLTPPGAITGFTTVAAQSVSFGNVPTAKLITINQGQFFPFSSAFNINEEYQDEFILIENPTLPYLVESELQSIDTDLITNNPFTTITVVGSPYIIKRHLVATKKITNYNGVPMSYTFYFVPNAIIENNTDLFLNNISFYDQDLLEDASHLFDNYPAIPAVASLSLYHNRLVACASAADISLAILSHVGEPEAISQIDGLLVVPLDGNPITNAQELRDVLYVTKRAKTVSFIDNGNEPSEWPLVLIDSALGSPVHGIATVLDSGASTVDYLIVATYQGISLFNGRYVTPELSWKIENYWRNLDRNEFRKIQIVNSPVQKELYIILPTGNLLVGNYANGLDPMKMRWSPWTFTVGVNSVGIWNIDEIIIGANET